MGGRLINDLIEKEALSVAGDLEPAIGTARQSSGVEQPLRRVCFDLGIHAEGDRHEDVAGGKVEELFSVATPARALASR